MILIDSAASWGLTDALGRRLSCYDGAIRIYWPKFTLKDDPHRHPLWTADRLESIGDDPRQTLERFRKQIRSDVMHASALGVVRPKEIDEIRNSSIRAAFAEMKAKASSLADFEALADSYANDNDNLREELGILYDTISELEEQKANLEREKASLLGRIENAELRLIYIPNQPIAPGGDSDAADGDEPKEDEIRYNKNKYSTKNAMSWNVSTTADTTRGKAQTPRTKQKKGSLILRTTGRTGKPSSTAGLAKVGACGA
ncbi:MAG: hypothetical protein KJ042_05450 [Deltaproteobacteria bacterium]|nr:hypothetical protein [Deltaproteobacteria bacterium]